MIFLLPIKNLVFWYHLSPWDSLLDTLMWAGASPVFHLLGAGRSRTCVGSHLAVTEQGLDPWSVSWSACPLLSRFCSPDCLTLKNEILTLPAFFPSSVRKSVGREDGDFQFNSASVQIAAYTADSQKKLLPRTWGRKCRHVGVGERTTPVGPWLPSFCILYLF